VLASFAGLTGEEEVRVSGLLDLDVIFQPSRNLTFYVSQRYIVQTVFALFVWERVKWQTRNDITCRRVRPKGDAREPERGLRKCP
jgi:hypothetical protein